MNCNLTTGLLLTVLLGCGRSAYELADVRGRVMTCQGKPATGGVVMFQPIDDPAATGRKSGNPGRPARGTVGLDGSFTLATIGIEEQPGAVTGRHLVTFKMPPTKRPTLTSEDRVGMSPDEIKKWEAEFATWPVYSPLPCSDQIQPGEVTVKSGTNELEFKLPPK